MRVPDLLEAVLEWTKIKKRTDPKSVVVIVVVVVVVVVILIVTIIRPFSISVGFFVTLVPNISQKIVIIH